jgi:hypothetical protein
MFQPLVDLFKLHPNTELVLQIGKNIHGEFKAGVSFEYIFDLQTFCGNGLSIWEAATEDEDPDHVLTSLNAGNITGEYQGDGNAIYYKKTILGFIDVHCPFRGLAARLCLSSKEFLPKNYQPLIGAKSIIFCESWEYNYKNTWVYKCKKLATAKNKSEVGEVNPYFEVDLSVTRGVDFKKINVNNHLSAKLKQLFGEYNINNRKIDLNITVFKRWISEEMTGKI